MMKGKILTLIVCLLSAALPLLAEEEHSVQPMNQGDFAEKIVKAQHLEPLINNADPVTGQLQTPTESQCIAFLTNIAVEPQGGWQPDKEMDDKALNSALTSALRITTRVEEIAQSGEYTGIDPNLVALREFGIEPTGVTEQAIDEALKDQVAFNSASPILGSAALVLPDNLPAPEAQSISADSSLSEDLPAQEQRLEFPMPVQTQEGQRQDGQKPVQSQAQFLEAPKVEEKAVAEEKQEEQKAAAMKAEVKAEQQPAVQSSAPETAAAAPAQEVAAAAAEHNNADPGTNSTEHSSDNAVTVTNLGPGDTGTAIVNQVTVGSGDQTLQNASVIGSPAGGTVNDAVILNGGNTQSAN